MSNLVDFPNSSDIVSSQNMCLHDSFRSSHHSSPMHPSPSYSTYHNCIATNVNVDESLHDEYIDSNTNVNDSMFAQCTTTPASVADLVHDIPEDRNIEPLPAMTAFPSQDNFDCEPSITLDRSNMTIALLPNREKVLTLIDSGASDSLVCASFVQQSNFLSKLPKITIPTRKFKVGNGEYITSRFALEIPIQIQGHKFLITAIALDTLGGINLVLGTPALREIDATLEFRHNRLRFRHTTFVACLTRSVTLQPGQLKIVNLTARIPAVLRNAALFIRTSRYISQFTASNMLLRFRNGFASLVVSNPTNRTMTLSQHKPFGIIDLKYLTQIYRPVCASAMSDQSTQLFCFSTVTKCQNELDHSFQSIVSDTTPTTSPTVKLTDRDKLYQQNSEKFPFLDKDDPRLKMTDREIIDRDITFHKSPLDPDQQQRVKDLLFKYKDALSLHSEVGSTNLTIHLDLTDDTPFYIRPFTVSSAEKPIIDRELQKLVQMGVLQEDHSAYSSPVMLIKKKGTTDLRLVTDFRHLNSRIVKRNLPFPLIREAIQTIGEAQPTILSVLDLKQAYHCLKLSKQSQNYCGITSYFGGKSFKYLRLPMGLSVSPAAFQRHINTILDQCNAQKFCIGIMDDLIIFSKSTESHFEHLETILHALEQNGLKISPSKAKLFRSKVVYMGHEILINKQQQGIRALRDRTEAIRKLPLPRTKRQLKGFIGKVSYLSMYLPKLQILLQPLHKIASKKAEFIWTEDHQRAYDSIIQLLVKPPILSLPRAQGLLRLYVDTSRIGVGASLWQIQDGQERLLAYFSKVLPKAACHYSVTELELTGVTIAVSAFKHLLKSTAFEVYTDHASIPQIMKSKVEPQTDRIKRLLEKLSSYAIKIGFKKGSSLVIADYLSRNPMPTTDWLSDEIAFPMLTRRQAASQGISVPTVQETVKSQTIKQVYKQPTVTTTGPASAPLTDVPPPPAAPADDPPLPAAPADDPPLPAAPADEPAFPAAPAEIPTVDTAQPTVTNSAPQANANNAPPLVPSGPPVSMVPTVAPPVQRSPPPSFVPGGHSLVNPRGPLPSAKAQPSEPTPSVTETHSQPPASLLRKSAPLQLEPQDVITRHLPKQSDIDKLLKRIDQSRIQDIHLPRNKRELAQMQSTCPNFKDMYAYILDGILPAPKLAAKRILAQSENFIMIDKVLFKLPASEYGDLQLVVPQCMVNEILFLYHDSLLAGHQGVARVIATIRQKFHFPRMSQLVLNYIRSCRVCQSRKTPVDQERPFHLNIPTEYVPFQTVHADLKVMPPSSHHHRYLLVLVCNITRYVILVPIPNKEAHTVAEAILQKCVFQFGPFQEFVCDQGKEWNNTVINYIFQALQVNQRFVSVNNHQSNKSERFIATVSSLLTSYLTNNGRNWHLYVNSIAYAYNSFASPSLGNHSPFYLVYLRQPPTVFTCSPTTHVTSGYQEYVQILKNRLESIGKIMLDIQAKLQHEQAARQNKKVKNPPNYIPGMLVYLLAPSSSSLQIASRKMRLDYVGPLVIRQVLDRSHVILMTLDNKGVPTVIHVSRLKPAWIRNGSRVVNHIKDLDQRSKALLQSHQLVPTESDGNQTGLVPDSYNILRCRYKQGALQALLQTSKVIKHNIWVDLSTNIHRGKCKPNMPIDPEIKVSGSFDRFSRLLTC